MHSGAWVTKKNPWLNTSELAQFVASQSGARFENSCKLGLQLGNFSVIKALILRLLQCCMYYAEHCEYILFIHVYFALSLVISTIYIAQNYHAAFSSASHNFVHIYASACSFYSVFPNSIFHGANMGPIWALSAPDGPHFGPMNLAIRVVSLNILT